MTFTTIRQFSGLFLWLFFWHQQNRIMKYHLQFRKRYIQNTTVSPPSLKNPKWVCTLNMKNILPLLCKLMVMMKYVRMHIRLCELIMNIIKSLYLYYFSYLKCFNHIHNEKSNHWESPLLYCVHMNFYYYT